MNSSGSGASSVKGAAWHRTQVIHDQRAARFGQAVAYHPDQALLRAGDGDIGQTLPQRLTRLHPAHAGGGIKVWREHLYRFPLAALRLVDRDSRAMQERRPHARRKGDKGLLLIRFFDFYNGCRADLRVFGPHNMQTAEPRFAPLAQKDHLRPFDQSPCFQIKSLLSMFQRQLDPVADQWFPRQQSVIRRTMHRAERIDQPDARCIAPNQHRGTAIKSTSTPHGPDQGLDCLRPVGKSGSGFITRLSGSFSNTIVPD
ncbi:hypothetical protein GQR58_030201 [Nymphon striatum]|nr:hypothetical protein GQR58_030201 [Nymphon striatum]